MADLSFLRDEVTDTELPTELPSQGGGSFLVVLPQILTLRLPSNLLQCVEGLDEPVWQDAEKKTPVMDPKTGKQQVIQRLKWTFADDSPLTIVAPGKPELDGQPCPRVTITNIPRKRSSKADVPMVADALFLLRTSLAEPGTTLLQTPRQWVEAMARHAGELFRVETGLTGNCNKDKVRYIGVPQYDAAKQIIGFDSVEDPSGTKGCGKKYYTTDFKIAAHVDPQGVAHPATYSDRAFCRPKAGGPKPMVDLGCGAYIRGFFQIEKFLPRA